MMEDKTHHSSSSVTAVPATTLTASINIPQTQTENVSKDTLSGSNISGGLMCVVGQDGQTLILSDAEGRENIISGVTPDILQQVNKVKNTAVKINS